VGFYVELDGAAGEKELEVSVPWPDRVHARHEALLSPAHVENLHARVRRLVCCEKAFAHLKDLVAVADADPMVFVPLNVACCVDDAFEQRGERKRPGLWHDRVGVGRVYTIVSSQSMECPITLCPLHELSLPVAFASAPDQPYELEALCTWLDRTSKNPLTGEAVEVFDLVLLGDVSQRCRSAEVLRERGLTICEAQVIFPRKFNPRGSCEV